MSNLNTTTYIKKLVKVIYEKEKQIENLKSTIKTKQSIDVPSEEEINIDPQLKNQLKQTSLQLKFVNKQVLEMQGKMVQLSIGLKEQIQKNAKLEQEIGKIKTEEKLMNKKIQLKDEELQNSKEKIRNLQRNIEEITQKWAELSFQNKKLAIELENLKEEKTKENYEHSLLAKQLNLCQIQLKKKGQQYKQSLLKIKATQDISQVDIKEVEETMFKFAKLTLKITQLQSYNATLLENIQTTTNQFYMKENELKLLSEKLKDYEEFAFQIAHHIESSYLKHICKGSQLSSKKISKQSDNYKSKFESTYYKMSQIQLWMESTSEKLQKLIKDQQIPYGTLENISLIANSFQQKLELWGLTERIQKEMNEEILLNNLQKQCQKSFERETSKVVQLGELKQILKMIKDVNRELMDQVNKKEHIINQCKKIFIQFTANKQNPQYRAIKMLLNINH